MHKLFGIAPKKWSTWGHQCSARVFYVTLVIQCVTDDRQMVSFCVDSRRILKPIPTGGCYG